MENLINTIFPPSCIFCGVVGSIFCEPCLNQCKKIEGGFCIVCDKPSEDGMTHDHCATGRTPAQITSPFEYGDFVRGCIKVSKYGSKQFAALKVLTKHTAKIVWEKRADFEGYILVPVPMNRYKLKQRGFNQAEVIARILGKALNLPVVADVLIRTKETSVQYLEDRKGRFENLKDAFILNKKYKGKITGRKLLLVDDICTTGATLLESAKVLCEDGAGEVRCFTLAKKVLS